MASIQEHTSYFVQCFFCLTETDFHDDEQAAERAARRRGFVEARKNRYWVCRRCQSRPSRSDLEEVRKRWAFSEDDICRLADPETRPAVIAQWGYTAEKAAEEIDRLMEKRLR